MKQVVTFSFVKVLETGKKICKWVYKICKKCMPKKDVGKIVALKLKFQNQLKLRLGT